MGLPFPDNTFDCVTVGWGLRNVPDILKAVKEMVRVVKPEGKVVSIDMGQPSTPLFKELYWWCFAKFVPAMGRVWGRSQGAYKYLYHSSRQFLSPQELITVFNQAGLIETTYHLLFQGIIAEVEGKKPLLPRNHFPHFRII